MSVTWWARVGLIGSSLMEVGCLGTLVTPVATTADMSPAPAAGGWTVSNTFRDVSFEEFKEGGVVIVPLRTVMKPGYDPHDDRSTAFSYETDIPNSNLDIHLRYLWGGVPVDNGHGTFHWYHERLLFDLKAHQVFVVPRRNPQTVDRETADGRQFWCSRDELRGTTRAIDNTRGYLYDLCPTAFIRTTGETKGIPFLLGTQKEVYIIDVRRIAALIAELHLDETVTNIKGAEDMNRQLTTIAQVQETEQRSLVAERVRTALPRGQAMIDRAEQGALLCTDIQVGNMPAVISAFLEGVHGQKVQLRVNNIRSVDGRSTITLKVPLDGIDYTSGNVVWVNRQAWRACE